ncbi:hypothetical protein BXZ70DRAFT_929332 [Cristinia sonorae]|uniref:Uncharacterized protein n=1 Tax=Cristinia sonorae TaxID=1940300 RepID=A0A8K0UT19_9AGAR|nr:hypothetical protein BXZ70DRAFT_929332 [Cristinia sonorae]
MSLLWVKLTGNDCILITTLDLIHRPENAQTKGVALAAQVDCTDVKAAEVHPKALLSGQEPPKIPDIIPKLFQISAPIGLNIMPGLVTGTIQKVKDEA